MVDKFLRFECRSPILGTAVKYLFYTIITQADTISRECAIKAIVYISNRYSLTCLPPRSKFAPTRQIIRKRIYTPHCVRFIAFHHDNDDDNKLRDEIGLASFSESPLLHRQAGFVYITHQKGNLRVITQCKREFHLPLIPAVFLQSSCVYFHVSRISMSDNYCCDSRPFFFAVD